MYNNCWVIYTLLINGARSELPGQEYLETRLGRPPSSCLVMYSNSTIPVVLCEDDIPGTSLAGRQPASLKNDEFHH